MVCIIVSSVENGLFYCIAYRRWCILLNVYRKNVYIIVLFIEKGLNYCIIYEKMCITVLSAENGLYYRTV